MQQNYVVKTRTHLMRKTNRLTNGPMLLSEGEQNTPPQNVPLRHVDCFDLEGINTSQTQEKKFFF